MSIYKGNTKLRAYRGDCRPANVYLGDRKLTGWHEEAVSGTGRAELTDTYNDVTGGKLYGKAELAAPDCMYREYSGEGSVTIDNTIAAPVKGVRIQGRTVYPKDGGAAYSVTNPAVKVCGRNVFSHETYGGQYLVQTEVLEDGRIKTTGLSETTAIGHGTFRLFLGTGDYTMQASCETNTQTAHSLYVCKKPDGTGGIVSYTFYGAGAVPVKTFSMEQPGQYYMFLNVGGMTGDESITAVQIIQGSYTADTIPPYEPYKENTITLPYTLRSTEDGAVYDMLDTVTGQLTRRVGEDGAVLETPVVTDITGDDSPQGYDGTAHFTLSDDNSVADVPFSVIAATKETPIQPDTLNPYSLVCVKNPTLTIRGRNLFDVMDAVEKTPSATYIDGVFSASGDFSYTMPLDPQKTYTVYAEGLEGDVRPGIQEDWSFLEVTKYDANGKMGGKYWGREKGVYTVSRMSKLIFRYGWATGGLRFNTRDIMVLEGSYTLDTIPRFEPYITPQTIPIPGSLYALKDNHGYTVRDSLDLSQKKIIRQCGRYDFTGNEAWSAGTAAYNGENTTNRYLSSNLYGNYNVNAGEICTHLKRSIETLWTKDYEGFTINAAQIHLRLPNALLGITPEDDSAARTAKFKAYLSKNRVSLIGKLKTPTEEPIDIPDIPSFYPATVVECTDENGNKVDMELILKQQDE